MARWLSKGPCDKCSSSDAKWYHDDGHAFCFSCRAYFPADNQKREVKVSRWRLEDIEAFPHADLRDREINLDTTKAYDVRQAVTPETGEPSNHIFYRSGLGEGWKRKNKKNKRDMEIIGGYSGLFGQQRLAYGGRFIILTEGEEDALSAWYIFNTKKGKDYNIASVPNGSGLGGVQDQKVYELLTSFETILLAFDQDEPGKEALDRFAEIYGPSVSIRFAEWGSAKDINDLLTQGRAQDFLKAVNQSREYKPETVVQGAEIPFESISQPIRPGIQIRQFPELSKKLGGLRSGELTTVIAPSGVGKSSVVAEIGYDVIKNTEERAAWLFLEETKEKAAQRLIALDNNVPLFQYRLNPSIISEQDRWKSYNSLINNDRTKFINLKHGILDKNRLLPLLRWYHYTEGVKFFFFDHISLVFSADRDGDERKSIDNTLHDLAAFVSETGCSFTLVAHIKRMNNKFYVNDEENGAKWLQVDADQARGSGSFEQMSFNLLTLEPEYLESGEKGRTRIKIAKNREQGILGVADIIQMNPRTGRLESLTTEF